MRFWVIALLNILICQNVLAQGDNEIFRRWEIAVGDYGYFPISSKPKNFPNVVSFGVCPSPTTDAINVSLRYNTQTKRHIYYLFNVNGVGFGVNYRYKFNSSTPSTYAGRGGYSEIVGDCKNIDLSLGVQINKNKNSRLYSKSGINIMFNQVGAFYPTSNRNIQDSVNTFMAHFAFNNERRMGYGINQAFIFEQHIGRFAAGIGIFGQLGFRNFVTYKLDLYYNGNNFSGYVRSKGDAIGAFVYVKVYGFGKGKAKSNAEPPQN